MARFAFWSLWPYGVEVPGGLEEGCVLGFGRRFVTLDGSLPFETVSTIRPPLDDWLSTVPFGLLDHTYSTLNP